MIVIFDEEKEVVYEFDEIEQLEHALQLQFINRKEASLIM